MMESVELLTSHNNTQSMLKMTLNLHLMVLLMSLPMLGHAELGSKPTVEQLRSDAREFLNSVHQKASTQFAIYGTNATDIESLGVKLPFFLKSYYMVAYTAKSQTDFGYELKLTGWNAPVQNETYLIDESGSLVGMTQFENVTDLDLEIRQLLLSAYVSEKAYFAESSKYSSDLTSIGLVVSPALAKFGTFSITLTPAGFTAVFVGNRYPVLNQKYIINETRTISAP
jgi:hypothetical protein